MSLSDRLKSLRKPIADHWGNALGLGLMRLLARAPLPLVRALGWVFGRTLHAVAGFIDRPVLETAQRDRTGGIELHAQLLVQLAGQRLQRRFARLGLAAGLDEAVGAVLAHHHRPAAVIQDDRGYDLDRGRGVAHFRFCSNSLRMRLYWSSQESART